MQLYARLVPRAPFAVRAQALLVRPADVLDDPHDRVRASVRAQVQHRPICTDAARPRHAPEEGLKEGTRIVPVRGRRDVLLVEDVVQQRAELDREQVRRRPRLLVGARARAISVAVRQKGSGKAEGGSADATDWRGRFWSSRATRMGVC